MARVEDVRTAYERVGKACDPEIHVVGVHAYPPNQIIVHVVSSSEAKRLPDQARSMGVWFPGVAVEVVSLSTGDDYILHFARQFPRELGARTAEEMERQGFVLKTSGWSINSADPKVEFRRVVDALGKPPVDVEFIPARGKDAEHPTYRNC